MKQIKTNKGFSLIEVLVTMGLIGILTAIALPAYRNYRSNANETVLKADAGNGYKAMHAYNAVNGTFCGDSLETLGLKALSESGTYTEKAEYYVGFEAAETGCTHKSAHKASTGSNVTAAECKIGVDTFALGVANKFAGNLVGYSVSNANSSPTGAAAGTCNVGACKTPTECTGTKDANCANSATGTAAVWTPGNNINKLCP